MLVTGICCGVLPFLAGMALFFKAAGNKNLGASAMPAALAVSVIPPLILILISFYSLVAGFDGLCIGPPDYTAPCTFSEYLDYHLFKSAGVFGYVLFCLLSLGWTGLVFGVAGVYYKKHENSGS